MKFKRIFLVILDSGIRLEIFAYKLSYILFVRYPKNMGIYRLFFTIKNWERIQVNLF